MNNHEEFERLWSEGMNSFPNSEAHSYLRRTNREGSGENVGGTRQAESTNKRKMKRVKRRCMSQNKLLEKKRQRDHVIRTQIQALQELTPNCPKSDINAILDSVIEYTTRLRLAVFLINSIREM